MELPLHPQSDFFGPKLIYFKKKRDNKYLKKHTGNKDTSENSDQIAQKKPYNYNKWAERYKENVRS